jgi:hypothetical protein
MKKILPKKKKEKKKKKERRKISPWPIVDPYFL